MRVLMLNHNVAFGGGTFVRAFHFGRQLVRFGHEVTLISISARARLGFHRERRHGVDIVCSPDLLHGFARTGWDPWDTIRRVLFVERARFDLVYAFDSRPVVTAPALAHAERHDVPLIMDWADWWGRGGAIVERPQKIASALIAPFEAWLEEAFRTRADATTVVSRALEVRAVSLGVAGDRIHRIPNGCDPEAVRPRDLAASRRALGLEGDRPILGVLGTLYPRDAELLAASLEELRRQGVRARLAWIGRPRLARRWIDLRLPDLVEPGFVPEAELSTWLSACDLFLLPLTDSVTNRGRWPGKLNDYLAAGRAVVGTRVGELKELFEGDRPWGSLAEPTPLAFAGEIRALLEDPARRAALGARAREIAENELSWRIVGERIPSVLETATAPKS